MATEGRSSYTELEGMATKEGRVWLLKNGGCSQGVATEGRMWPLDRGKKGGCGQRVWLLKNGATGQRRCGY